MLAKAKVLPEAQLNYHFNSTSVGKAKKEEGD